MADENKSEKPTEYKKKKSREQGQVLKSIELSALLLLLPACVLLKGALADLPMAMPSYLLTVEQVFAASNMALLDRAWLMCLPLLQWLLLFFSLMLVAAVVIGLLQVGLVFSPKTLSFKGERVNPVAGFKRIYSRSPFELLKMCLKLTIFLLGFLYCAYHDAPQVALQVSQAAGMADALKATAGFVYHPFLFFVAALLSLAVADYLYNRRKHFKQLMMSRHEVKEENKMREGDPEIKSKRKKYMREIIENSNVVKRVKDSDFVLVNPDHIAILLRYVPSDMLAPEVIGKARGQLVEQVKAEARRCRTPIVRDVKLARAMYRMTSTGSAIQPEFYEPVAGIYNRSGVEE